jgi:hypothetical protein
MRIKILTFFCFAAIIVFVFFPSTAQAQISGKVTQQILGSVGHLPETRNLAGASIIIGTDLELEIGPAGNDTVHGRVAAKVISADDGTFTLNVPAGNYTVICWKQGYVPIQDGAKVPGKLNLDISKDSSGRGLHSVIHFVR